LSRWRVQKKKGSLEDGLSGPRQAPHRLLPEERDAFLALAAREDLADASVPVLCAYGSDTDVVHLSSSTGYRLLKEAHLSEPRGSARHRHPLPRINHDLAVSQLPLVLGYHPIGDLYVGTLLLPLCDPG